MSELSIESPAFPPGGMIPPEYTCDGPNVVPPLSIRSVPEGTRTLALIVDDPDSPSKVWVHWLIWNILPDRADLPRDTVPSEAIQGMNDFGEAAYGGPCPRAGTHRYFFKLYALDAPLSLPSGATKGQLEKAMEGHLLGKAEMFGTYRRK